MTSELHIITQCTDRKRVPVPSGLQLRTVGGRSVASRAAAWFSAVRAGRATTPAQELYAGEHWRTILEAVGAATARGLKTRLWVASAGLGLIAAEAPVPAYSATFAAGVPDSVIVDPARPVATQRWEWWEALETLNSGSGVPSLAALMKRDSRATFLVVASPSYLQAMQPSLERAARKLKSPDQLAIVSGEASSLVSGELAAHWVPSNEKHLARVGGSRIGLHASVARALLRDLSVGPLGASAMRKCAEAWLAVAPEVKKYDRAQRSDRQVTSYIRTSKAGSWSRALREFRGSGFACEQKRFRKLFGEVRA